MEQQLQHAAANVNELNADRNHQQLEKLKTIRIIDPQVQLTEMSMWNDNTMSSQVNDLQTQLQAAVSQKLEAVAGLETIEGNEEHLNIANEKDNLTNNVIELMAVQSKLTATVARLEKSEQLMTLNSMVCQLNEANEKLKTQNEKYERQLSEQLTASHRVMKAYDKDLKAKTDLAELYRENNVDYQAENDELTAGVIELKKLLVETIDGCGILETRLKQSESDHQMLSDAQEEIICKLRRELNDANRLLKECANVDGNNEEIDGEDELTLSKRLTFTEMYSQYCQVLKELRNKEQEYQILEMEMTIKTNDAKEKAKEFELQRNKLKKHQATNEKLIEQRENSLVETVAAREELQIYRLRCELLQDECNKMKSFGSGNEKLVANNCVTSTDNLSSVTENIAINSYSREATDIQELKIEKLTELNRKLINEVRELIAEKNSIAAEANLSNVRNSIRQQQFESLEKQNQTYVDMIDETKITAKYLRDATAKAIHKLSTAEDRCEHLQNEQRSLSDAKQSLTAELQMLKEELAEEKLTSQNLRKCLEVMEMKPLKSSTQIGLEIGDSHTMIVQTGVVTTHYLVEDFSHSKEKTFSPPPQLTKSHHRTSESESLQSNSSPDSRKRSVNDANTYDSASSSGSSKRHPSSKKPREESDDNELTNVWDDEVGRDLPNINLPNLLEVRPPKQAQLYDAFHNPQVSWSFTN